MADLVLTFKGEKLPVKHIPGPEGVRGRNSDNMLIKQVLGWAPSTPLKEGLKYTYDWISSQIEDYKKAGNTVESLTQSKVVSQQMADACDMGSKAKRRRQSHRRAACAERAFCGGPAWETRAI